MSRTRPYDEGAVKNALLDHAFRTTLHRLRGVQSLLVGWAEIGAGGEEAGRLKHHYEECGVMLARLEWLHGARTLDLSMERLIGGESPQVLLAAAAYNAAPEELKSEPLPQIATAEAALALSLWLEAQRPQGEATRARFAWRDGCLEVHCENGVAVELADWSARWSRYLVSAEPRQVRFQAGCFAPGEESLQAQ